jgi:uncharacterized membrane-anchored protein
VKNRLVMLSACFVVLQLLCAHAAFGQGQSQDSPISWKRGPLKADLGEAAEISVPAGFLFTDKKGAQKLLELTHNFPNGNEVGAIIPVTKEGEDVWFIIFEFHGVGFVKDDERDKLDKGALLESIRSATEESNKVRAERGWPAFHIIGWQNQPFYDQHTNNLTWAILGSSDSGHESVNHSMRILGRHGTMNVDAVMSPDVYAKVVPQFDQLVSGFRYREGNRYSDFVSGDKVAGYGLTALIAGGAGALAVKTGLLMKLWKFIVMIFAAAWKAIVALVVALLAWIKRVLNKLMGKREEPSPTKTSETTEAPTEPSSEADETIEEPKAK